jgi:hypothetical protein
MFVPRISARMEQIRATAAVRVNTGQVRALVQIALSATPTQVVKITRSTVHASHNVIYMKGPLVRFLRQPTIFAATTGSFLDLSPSFTIHKLRR